MLNQEKVFYLRLVLSALGWLALCVFALAFVMLLLPRTAQAAEADAVTLLQWQAPTENADGSPLTDLGGFRIFWGTESRNYSENLDVPNAAATEYTLTIRIADPALPVRYYFAMTAYDTEGTQAGYDAADNESEFSNEISREFDLSDVLPPGAPRIIGVDISCRVTGNGVKCRVDGVITE